MSSHNDSFVASGNSPTRSIIRLHREGKMPSLEELLRAVAETRAEFRPKILAARWGNKKS
jgi:hypothetical protein